MVGVGVDELVDDAGGFVDGGRFEDGDGLVVVDGVETGGFV